MAVRAFARNLRVAPRKARLVADLVRNRSVEEALALLSIENKKSAPLVAKVIKSAAANAEVNAGLNKENLVITHITVNEGQALKRFLPRAKGSASKMKHRLSHIEVVVSEDPMDTIWRSENKKHANRKSKEERVAFQNARKEARNKGGN